MLFVQLTCAIPTLLSRVHDTSRLASGKITQAAELQNVLDHNELFEPIPDFDSFRLDTTSLPPAQAARLIVTHYLLRRTASDQSAANGRVFSAGWIEI